MELLLIFKIVNVTLTLYAVMWPTLSCLP